MGNLINKQNDWNYFTIHTVQKQYLKIIQLVMKLSREQ